MENLRKQLTDFLPPIFAATSLDTLTGQAVRWRTIQNIRSRNKNLPQEERIPEKCFLKAGGRKVLIVREPFLDWWLSRLLKENPHME